MVAPSAYMVEGQKINRSHTHTPTERHPQGQKINRSHTHTHRQRTTSPTPTHTTRTTPQTPNEHLPRSRVNPRGGGVRRSGIIPAPVEWMVYVSRVNHRN